MWQPFDPGVPIGRVHRSLSKTIAGDRLRFEEHHPGLGLTFRYTWAAADRFGSTEAICSALTAAQRARPAVSPAQLGAWVSTRVG